MSVVWSKHNYGARLESEFKTWLRFIQNCIQAFLIYRCSSNDEYDMVRSEHTGTGLLYIHVCLGLLRMLADNRVPDTD